MDRAEVGSVASKQSKGAASIKTKFRPVSKLDTPSEIKKTESERLGTNVAAGLSSKCDGHGKSEKPFLMIFMLLSMAAIYWTMIPSSKV